MGKQKTIRVDCNCGTSFKVNISLYGKRTLCPHCKALHEIELNCCERALFAGKSICPECGYDTSFLPKESFDLVETLQKRELDIWMKALRVLLD